MGLGQRLIHPMQFGEVAPGRGPVSSRELEVDIQVEAGGIDRPEVVAIDVTHARIVGGRVEGGLVGRAAAVEVGPALVGHEADAAAEPLRPLAGQPVVRRHPLHGRGDVGTRIGQDAVDGGRGGGGLALGVGGRDVGGDGDRVEGPAHALGDPVAHPVDGGPAGGHPHQPRLLAGVHGRPDVEVAFRLAAGHLPVVQAGVFRQGELPGHPLRRLESPAEVPDLVGPLHVDLATGLEMVADIGREVGHEAVVGHVGHVEPGVRVEIVGQLHHVFE